MDRIPLETPAGEHVEWLNENQARDLLRKHQARFVRRKGNVRALILLPAAARPDPAPGRNRQTRYSHDHEVAETYVDDHGKLRRRHPLDANPRGCWTLKRLDDSLRRIFTVVVDEIKTAA